MKKGFLVVVLLLSVFVGRASGQSPYACDELTVTANGTSRIFEMRDKVEFVQAWLSIVTAGSGTVSVAVNIFGPDTVPIANRPFALFGTLNAATTRLGDFGIVQGMNFVTTGCTGCTIKVFACGARP